MFKGYWTVKGLNFFLYAGVGVFLMFLNVYYKGIGLSGTQIGLINTLGALAGIFSSILWGALNDRFGRPRPLFAAAVLGVITFALILAGLRVFVWILPAACALALFSSPIMPLLDSTALSQLGENRKNYGQIRAWGTAGFVVASSLAGFVYERTGLHAMFYGYILMMAVFLVISANLPGRVVRALRPAAGGMFQMIRQQPLWLIFVVGVAVLWLGNTGMQNFLGVTIKEMGGSDSLIGLSWTVSALIEIPGMLLGARLLSRIKPSRLISVAFLGYAARLTLLAWMPAPAWALGISLLQIVSYVPFWIGAVAYANELAPDHLKATTQSLLSSALNLSSVFGGLLSGWLFDSLGSPGLFLVLAGCCMLGMLIFSAGQVAFTSAPAQD